MWLLKRSVEFCKRWLLIVDQFLVGFCQKTSWRDKAILLMLGDLFTAFSPFLKTGMTYGSSSKWIILLPEIYIYYYSLVAKRCMSWYAIGTMGSHSRSVWTSEQFTHTFRTNEDHSWLNVCKSLGGHSDLMELLLGICWIPLKPCRSHSDFLGAVERLFVLCESWLCLSLKICHQRPKVLLCSYICVIDWACFIQ